MTSRREPFLPLFVGDFIAATGEWSGQEQGLYLLLLAHQWAVGSLPADADRLAQLARWDRKSFMRCWPVVSVKFEEREGRLYNQRLEEHRGHAVEISKKRAAAGRDGAAKTNGKRSANAAPIAAANAEVLSRHQSINDSELLRSSGASAPHNVDSENPPDPRTALWTLGVSLLGEKSRSVIGAACKRVGETKVAQILGEMATDPKADPKAWFVAATSERKREVVC